MADQPQRARLRIALLSLDGRIREWQLSALRAAEPAGEPGSPAKLDLMVLRPPRARRQEDALWRLLRAAEQGLFGPRRRLWEPVPVPGEGDADGGSGSSERPGSFSEADPADLVLDCIGVEDAQAWAARARLGLLRVRFGDGFDEAGIDRALAEWRPWLAISAELVTPERTRVLAATVMTLVKSRSFSRARESAARRARQVLIRAIARLNAAREGGAAAPADPGLSEFEPSRQGTPASVSGWQGLAVLVKSGVKAAAGAARSALFRVDHWFLAYRTEPDKFIANSLEMTGEGMRIFSLDPTRFYADPCVLEHEGGHHVFFEEFSYKKRKGVISWSQLQADGTLSPPSIVLEEPTHLSYPFVFAYEGGVYMVPETSRRREIALYEARDFPHGWRKAVVLLENVSASDATLHMHDGLWWLFVNIRHDGFSGSDELFLFHARSPFGPWTAHPGNPIKSDVRSARSAGRLFYHRDRLIRPAQDRSGAYGGALLLCEVQELTTARYREAIVKRLDPDWLAGNSGFHTLSFSRNLEVIDGKLDLPRWRAREGSGPGS